MKMPLSIRPEFIGKLIAMQAVYKGRNTPVFELLCQAVKQCRGFNSGDAPREQLWPYMEQTQKHLARLGIVVG